MSFQESTNKHITSEDIIDFIADQDLDTRARLAVGVLHLRYDVSREELQTTEFGARHDPYVIELPVEAKEHMLKDQRLKEAVADSFLVGLQIAPDAVERQLNMLRQELARPALREAALIARTAGKAEFEGTIIDVRGKGDERQFKMKCDTGDVVVLSGKDLESEPAANKRFKVTFKPGEEKAKVMEVRRNLTENRGGPLPGR